MAFYLWSRSSVLSQLVVLKRGEELPTPTIEGVGICRICRSRFQGDPTRWIFLWDVTSKIDDLPFKDEAIGDVRQQLNIALKDVTFPPSGRGDLEAVTEFQYDLGQPDHGHGTA